MDEEIESIERNDTWELVDLPVKIALELNEFLKPNLMHKVKLKGIKLDW